MTTRNEHAAFLETGRYIYENRATRWITERMHARCANLRQLDLAERTVLDVGCGEGDHFKYVRRASLIGVDPLSEMLERAEQKHPGRATLLQGSALSLDGLLAPSSIDSVSCVSVLEHITPIERALDQMARVLRGDGELIWGIPTEGLLYRIGRELTTKRHVQKVTGVDYDALVRSEHVNRCEDIVKALRERFVVEAMRGIPFWLSGRVLNVFLVGRCTKR